MAKSEVVEVGTISKADLIRLAQRSTDRKTTHEEMNDAYTALCSAIEQSLMNGNTVIIPGIGRLIPIIRPGGVGRNPSTGETIEYGDRLGLSFKINVPFKLALREVDIKSLGTGNAGKSGNKAGSQAAAGNGGGKTGRGTSVAGKGSGTASSKPTASTRPTRSR